ncbi:MAG: tRNA (guanosine(37)-N1)-methyltransferase TrmD [Spirochaetales bacterium]|nr:tRNA (guanosine(37)-N1)-methyltransferase TrmD [Spirochaetales bacterium]
MKITVLTLFPEIIKGFFESSIMAKAVTKGLIEYELIDFREFTTDKHRTCDDYPYGGGAGMVLKAEPIARALDSLNLEGARVLFPSPSGPLFTQKKAREFAAEEHIVLLCGRYEGVDQRIIDEYIDDEVSIGDYVISSGEIASLVLIDGVYRLLDGVISSDSLEEESFEGGILEYPHYTRPEIFRDEGVPEVLLSGHHENIRKWRLRKGLEKTKRNRPDLLALRNFSDEVQEILKDLELADDKEG